MERPSDTLPTWRVLDRSTIQVTLATSLSEASRGAREELLLILERAELELGVTPRVVFEVQARPDLASPPRLTTGGRGDHLLGVARELMARSQRVDLVSAFVMDSGVGLLHDPIASALERGAHVRLLTGDYLGRTRPDALARLLTMARSLTLEEGEGHTPARSSFELRVVETESLQRRGIPTFHPKAWVFHGARSDVAIVGSSNLSRAALTSGVEWNLCVSRGHDPAAFDEVARAFEELWPAGRVVDRAWIEAYRERAELPADHAITPRRSVEPASADEEGTSDEPPTPRPSQFDALAALAAERRRGSSRALVIMATGLGKTWLAAFDVAQFERERGAPARVLFVAHRIELLRQAADTFSRCLPGRSVGFCVGGERELDADIVLASVFTLARGEAIERLEPDGFDYVVIDEVHHAAARSYERVLAHLRAGFLLGLTATPLRGDGVDVADLFGGYAAFEAGLGRGISSGALVPFHYFGVRDVIDYRGIPWRSGRFEPEALARAASTHERMRRLAEELTAHPGARTLCFCCTVAHAEFVAGWLEEHHGMRAAAVHSQPTSADRAQSLSALAGGDLDVICSVDLFNEGVDIPSVDRVVMLRPTGSRVVFLQQLGRGLRADPTTGKRALTVIDFVGNHHVFLDRMKTLLALGTGALATATMLTSPARLAALLPPGCTIDVELEAIDLLSRMVPDPSTSALMVTYEAWRARAGSRPRAAEVYTSGANPLELRRELGGWFELALERGDLDEHEVSALHTHRGLFDALCSGSHTRDTLALLEDHLVGQDAHAPPVDPSVAHGLPRVSASAGRLEVKPRTPALGSMLLELLEYLSVRRARLDGAGLGEGSSSVRALARRDPLGIELDVPLDVKDHGVFELDARAPDGSIWRLRFEGSSCSLARPFGVAGNALSELIDGLGLDGRVGGVEFVASPDGWSLRGVDAGATLPFGWSVGDVLEESELLEVVEDTPDEDLALRQARTGEHVLFLADRGALVTPTRTTSVTASAEVVEAVALTATGDGDARWRVHGPARREAGEDEWSIDEVDFTTWRLLGSKRGASRELPAGYSDWAKAYAARIVAEVGRGAVIQRGGKTLRVLDLSARGGVRVDGGEGGFGARTVSALDLAWAKSTHARVEGGDLDALDQRAVNLLRYLPGTPRGSTRYIDTGHALTLVGHLSPEPPEG